MDMETIKIAIQTFVPSVISLGTFAGVLTSVKKKLSESKNDVKSINNKIDKLNSNVQTLTRQVDDINKPVIEGGTEDEQSNEENKEEVPISIDF